MNVIIETVILLFFSFPGALIRWVFTGFRRSLKDVLADDDLHTHPPKFSYLRAMNEEQLISWVRKCMQPIGPIGTRPVMQGQAIYLEGVLFAYVAGEQLWFRTDDESDQVWDAAGSEWLRGTKKDGTPTYEPYRSAPESAYTDEKEMRKWAKQGMAAGKRGQKKL